MEKERARIAAMLKLDGIRACKLQHEKYSYTEVIALSMFNDDNLIVDMLEADATGYLLKTPTGKNYSVP